MVLLSTLAVVEQLVVECQCQYVQGNILNSSLIMHLTAESLPGMRQSAGRAQPKVLCTVVSLLFLKNTGRIVKRAL